MKLNKNYSMSLPSLSDHNLDAHDNNLKQQSPLVPDAEERKETVKVEVHSHNEMDEHKQQPFMNAIKKNLNHPSSPFKKNLFRKKKRKLTRNKKSYHLTVADPEGETTTDFDESDESPSDESKYCSY